MKISKVFTFNIVVIFSKKPVFRDVSRRNENTIRSWIVFFLSFLCSISGVVLAFMTYGSIVSGVRLWGVGIAISVIMLGITYGAKYASVESRGIFTPVDLVQYISQGFLWPSSWPALALFLGLKAVESPVDYVSLLFWPIKIIASFFS